MYLTTKGLTEESLIKDHPDYYEKILEFVKEENITLSEKIWLYQNNLAEIPKCLNCENKVGFIKFCKGYRKYCSRRCAAIFSHKNDDIKQKRIKKMIDCNYDINIRNKMTEKSKNTKSKFTKEKNLNINNKRKETNIKKYGVENVSKNEQIKNKISNSLKESLPFLSINKRIMKISENKLFNLINISKNDYTLSCNTCKGIFNITNSLFNQRTRFDIEVCTLCNPINGKSNMESKILEFISNNYNGQIISNYREYKKYEIDIFLPQLNIGIECNGLYWHSEIYKENKYHKEKTFFFKEKGIKIIHIWEDDWKFKKDIVTSRLNNIFNKNKKIYARKCKIIELSPNVTNEFLIKNHLQGNVNSKFKYGLLYENELVSIMTFGGLRKNLGKNKIEGHYELLRFCNSKNISVIGAASKLLKHFIKNIKPINIISYASIDWSDGKLYNTLGFEFLKETVPNYFYFHKDEGIRRNRFMFRKDILVKNGYDKNKTEHKIMNERGYYRIYDTGSLLYNLNIGENIINK